LAKAFQQWTVLPHGPLEKLTENVWRLEGIMPNGKTRRVMTLVRLEDGRLIIHNAIALEDELMKEVTSFGTPAAILVPNSFHRQDAKIMKDRFPDAKVYCPARATKGVRQVVPVDGSYADAPQDATVRVRHLDGVAEKEGVIEVTSKDGRTAVFCDTLLNMATAPLLFRFLLAPIGRLSVPNFSRWFIVGDKRALKADLERMAAGDLKRVIPGHGNAILDGAPDALKSAASLL
jgi:hypothetical protein